MIETEFILKSSKGKSFDDLQSDEVWQRAVVRSIEIIGEASKKVDPEHLLFGICNSEALSPDL